ncbi:MAG: CPBP family intramembrane metalloprotease, partial [Mesorhizobium sp.]
FSSWLLFLIPIVLLAFLQTSSEEMLFRGYLLRGLAYRFRSPWIWALLPGLLFTSLHWNSASTFAINACVLVSIGAFALLLTLLVYVTGNLGAGFGAHLGNNLTGFLLISHQEGYNGFALL